MVRRNRKMECKIDGCFYYPHLGGLCEEHYEEDQKKKKLCRNAVNLLHRGEINGERLTSDELLEELSKLQEWWHRICYTINSRRKNDELLGNEAEYAKEWCIRLAQQIVIAETKFRNKEDNFLHPLEPTRKWVWERFANLESGLRSNGTKRS